MKLEPGRCDYPLPDCGQLHDIVLDEGVLEESGHFYALMTIQPEEWKKLRGDPGKPPMRGRPLYFAWFGPELGLRLWPAPDADYELHVRYFPHMRVA